MSYCFICHRDLGDSYDLMWAQYVNKLVPVCSEDRECRALVGQRKKAAPKDGPNAIEETIFDKEIISREGTENNDD